MQNFEGQLWNLTLPPGWLAEPGEECTTFSHQDGVGALQISTYQKEDEVVRADLEDLAAGELAAGVTMTDCRLGEFHGFCGIFDEGHQHWKYWFVSAADCALCIIYNCDIENKTVEAGKVQQILYSLRINH